MRLRGLLDLILELAVCARACAPSRVKNVSRRVHDLGDFVIVRDYFPFFANCVLLRLVFPANCALRPLHYSRRRVRSVYLLHVVSVFVHGPELAHLYVSNALPEALSLRHVWKLLQREHLKTPVNWHKEQRIVLSVP